MSLTQPAQVFNWGYDTVPGQFIMETYSESGNFFTAYENRAADALLPRKMDPSVGAIMTAMIDCGY